MGRRIEYGNVTATTDASSVLLSPAVQKKETTCPLERFEAPRDLDPAASRLYQDPSPLLLHCRHSPPAPFSLSCAVARREAHTAGAGHMDQGRIAAFLPSLPEDALQMACRTPQCLTQHNISSSPCERARVQ